MFKTSQGKYVAPSAIAATFKGLCPFASEIIVYGESKPYCVALVSLDSEAIRSGLTATAWRASRSPKSLTTRRPRR